MIGWKGELGSWGVLLLDMGYQVGVGVVQMVERLITKGTRRRILGGFGPDVHDEMVRPRLDRMELDGTSSWQKPDAERLPGEIKLTH